MKGQHEIFTNMIRMYRGAYTLVGCHGIWMANTLQVRAVAFGRRSGVGANKSHNRARRTLHYYIGRMANRSI